VIELYNYDDNNNNNNNMDIMTLFFGPQSNESVTLTFQTLSGCRRAFWLGMAAWGWDVCLRLHFLPIWLWRRVHSPSRMKSSPDGPAPRTHSSRLLVIMVGFLWRFVWGCTCKTVCLGSPWRCSWLSFGWVQP